MGDNIFKPFNKGQCEKRYEHKGFCHSYFHKEFNLYPSVLSIRNDYLKYIRKFHDPILIYVALYLYHNYVIAYEYFIKKGMPKRYNTACAVLNRWLDQQKKFYTDFGKCYYNLRWWNISIESLWKKLKEYYPDKNCERIYSYYNPSDIPYDSEKQAISYHLIPEENVIYKDDDMENCDKLNMLFYLGEKYNLLNENADATNPTTNKYCTGSYEKINYTPVLKAEKTYFCESVTSTIALPIIVTALGTTFLAFFLNEFTPMGSILRTPSKNKLILHEQFNEEPGYNEYQTYRNNNQNTSRKKNIIYYQSMNK